jgi:hypothetical protein
MQMDGFVEAGFALDARESRCFPSLQTYKNQNAAHMQIPRPGNGLFQYG